MSTLWDNEIYKETAILVIAVIYLIGILLFVLRKKNQYTTVSWESIKSWMVVGPIIFYVFSLKSPWPEIGLGLLAITCSREFLQMTGMFHRTYFVWLSYFSFIGLAVTAYYGMANLYNTMPMIFLGLISLIPIFTNNAKNMIQYMALTLLAHLFVGWGFLHMIWIFKSNGGPLLIVFLIVLTEFYDQFSLSVSRIWGKNKIVDNITPFRTVEGFIVSAALTVLLGFSLRHLLPERSVLSWLSLSLTVILVGGIGNLILAVIRRDLGLRDTGVFVFGRGGFLDRIDRMIFVAPISYFIIRYLNESGIW